MEHPCATQVQMTGLLDGGWPLVCVCVCVCVCACICEEGINVWHMVCEAWQVLN